MFYIIGGLGQTCDMTYQAILNKLIELYVASNFMLLLEKYGKY